MTEAERIREDCRTYRWALLLLALLTVACAAWAAFGGGECRL